MTYFLGLTGGIATGKTTVSQMLAQQGIPIIDGDQVAHQVLANNQSVQAQIQATFGKQLVQDGQVDRAALGKLVFGNQAALAQLNAITAPVIRETIMTEMAQAKAHQVPLVVLDLPLLYEQHYETVCDGVLVIYLPVEKQLARLRARNQLSREDALKRINSQASLAEKRDRADFVIDNQGSLDQLKAQLKTVLEGVRHKSGMS
ncbi:dephospho-CoA kinase [Latilactobacillus sakei]|uniref:Dephospho-CoA kinase n=1 Tax=Latilactobacillus sakei TaxID=1599 RepID=A0AAE8LVI2_LATSK|nr:dephospho-CoA kinase [Latilactobacillus sakei]MCB4409453.1 dephospho-CoA kinase [Latilactobacillus sakei]MCP8856076.1 dephospho-CoA kinase [Latilactobacillus sakei]MDB1553322.1 dephospho-CoA kinase [Latilactobacillus sakei]QMU87247.1 dephospho-CoA kinase [Latilactobacillus sakei]QPG03818.1 dephospho-CoA kinase [Latilactobacillus sakei]